MSTTNFKKFTSAFLAGERSDRNIHDALIEMLAEFGRSNDKSTINLTKVVEYMTKRAPESARTNAIRSWLGEVAKFVVDGDVVRTVRRKEYDVKWLEACKAKPWYQHARDMQEFKVPSISLKGLASAIAKREYLGEEVDDIYWSELLTAIKAEVTNARISKSVKKWELEADDELKAGTIQRLA